MSAGVNHQHDETVVVLFPHQEPVGLDVTFPASGIIARQLVRPVLLWKFPVFAKYVDGFGKKRKVPAAFFFNNLTRFLNGFVYSGVYFISGTGL